MKHYILGILLLCAFLTLAATPEALAQDKPNYIVVKAGAYFPTGDLDDADFDTGFNGELAYGYRFNPNFALEGGIGYFESESDETVFDPFLGSVSIHQEVNVTPLSVTAKGIVPAGQAELYGGVGAGIYLVEVEVSGSALGITVSDDDDDTVFGVHILGGINFDITPEVYVGAEGKYIITDEAEATIFGATDEADLNGFTLTANLGFRF